MFKKEGGPGPKKCKLYKVPPKKNSKNSKATKKTTPSASKKSAQKKKAPGKKFNAEDWGFQDQRRKARGADYRPPDQHSRTLLCTVRGNKPRFVSQDQSFAIWNVVLEENGESQDTVIQGPLARVAAGEMLRCEGSWKRHPQHGWSFRVEKYESALPVNSSGVAAWLETRVDGIGPTFAKAVVEHFGANQVFDVLDADPGRLREVRSSKGRALPEAQVDKAVEAWDDARAIRQIEAFLFSHGVSANLADRLYRQYGEDVVPILQERPYQITEMRGIGFRIADRVALSMGIALDAPERLQAGILFVLEEAESDGHVFLGLENLLSRCMEALEVSSQEPLVEAASRLAADGKVVAESDEALVQRIYIRRLHRIECRLARTIRQMREPALRPLYSQPTRPQAPDGATQEEIEALRLPTDEQWEVMEDVRGQRLTILSGNPGVGKCVRGDTTVWMNGEKTTLEELWQKEISEESPDGEGYWKRPSEKLQTLAMNEEGDLHPQEVEHLYRQKVDEPGQKVTLLDGRSLVMTRRHRLLLQEGWDNVVLPGDRVAVWDNNKVAWLGVQSVEDIHLQEWVYDLEVAEDHNYIANGIVTHNTQSVNEIVRLADEHGLRLRLCAPTGKAARRMAELTQHEASTIHRLLEFSPWEGGFQRNEKNPLEADLVVVDEASMLSLDLADSLFRAISAETHVLLVGDPDQLPPVGVGKVLDDLIQSEAVPRVHLSRIFRQAARSMIIQNSRRINSGKIPYLSQDEAEKTLQQKMLNDFYWVTRKKPEDTLELTVDMAVRRIPQTFGFDPRTEIMVLAPMRKGKVGLEVLNERLESELNPPPSEGEKTLVVPRRNIYVGSRIVQTKNSYDEHHYVMNGELALVLDYKEDTGEALLSLDDGEREIWVPAADMDSYMLAWAMSIHRAQGSQWPCVVAPVSSSFYIMLTRSLVYTAVTRASRLCVMTGETRALSMAVDKIDARQRNSTLAARILDPGLSGEIF